MARFLSMLLGLTAACGPVPDILPGQCTERDLPAYYWAEYVTPDGCQGMESRELYVAENWAALGNPEGSYMHCRMEPFGACDAKCTMQWQGCEYSVRLERISSSGE